MTALDTTVHILETRGLLLLFLIAIVEGPIVTVIGAYVASLGYLNIFAVYFTVVAADLVGDAIFYMLGRAGNGVILTRWGPHFGVNEKRLLALEDHFRSHGGKTLLIGKLTHSAGFMILLAAGASRMSFYTFIWYNLLGTIPKSLFFLLIGYILGYAYNEIDSYIFRASLVIFVAILIIVSIWFGRRLMNRE